MHKDWVITNSVLHQQSPSYSYVSVITSPQQQFVICTYYATRYISYQLIFWLKTCFFKACTCHDHCHCTSRNCNIPSLSTYLPPKSYLPWTSSWPSTLPATFKSYNFQGQNVKGQLAGGGDILWQPPAQLVVPPPLIGGGIKWWCCLTSICRVHWA